MNITGKTKVVAIFGDPVSHSLSPVMHNGWFADYKFDAVYVAIPITGDPRTFFRGLRGARLAGANITVPHKEEAARAADRSTVAAANVWRWEPDGSVSAFNTDGLGFLDALTEAAPDWRARVKKVLILGAGGGARGIAEALQGEVEIVIANRTKARADTLVTALTHARAVEWLEVPAHFAAADLIVQTTTLGMSGSDSPAWPVELCKPDAIVADIVYRPLETPLLKAAREHGLTAVDGLGMLIHQGARAFEYWFGVKPDAKKARKRLLAALQS